MPTTDVTKIQRDAGATVDAIVAKSNALVLPTCPGFAPENYSGYMASHGSARGPWACKHCKLPAGVHRHRNNAYTRGEPLDEVATRTWLMLCELVQTSTAASPDLKVALTPPQVKAVLLAVDIAAETLEERGKLGPAEATTKRVLGTVQGKLGTPGAPKPARKAPAKKAAAKKTTGARKAPAKSTVRKGTKKT